MSPALDDQNEGSLGVLVKALAATTSGVLITDPNEPDNPIIYVNDGFVRMTGYSKEETMGKNCRFLQGKDTSEESLDRLREAIATRQECKVTLRNYRKDGSMFWNELAVSPVFDDGKLTNFIGIQTDVTEREEMSRVQSSLDLAESIYETVRESLVILDGDLRVFRANRSFYRAFGVSREETEGKLLYELGDHQWDIPALKNLLERILPTQNPFDDFAVDHEFPEIGQRSMLLNARRMEKHGVPEFILLAIEDITQRQAHAESLRQAEDRYRLLAAKIRDYAIILLDTEGRVTAWNPGAQRIFGYTDEEIIGQSVDRFFSAEDRENDRPVRELHSAISGGEASDDGWQIRKDGSHFWASGVTTALFDEGGKLRGFSKIVRDLTERKLFEQELVQRAEGLAQRDRAKDEFLAMLSHELRNPLNAIAGAIYLAEPKAETDEDLRNSLAVAARQVETMTALINDLLEVSRITQGKVELKPKRVTLNEILSGSIRSTETKLLGGKRLAIRSELAPGVLVDADPLRLDQIFQNLLGNAVKFTAEGEVAVKLFIEDKNAIVQVRDTGIGIEPEFLPHVFDLFRQGERTLARSEGGLGIGLTIVQQLVTLHGGTIEATSEGIGRGTTFTVCLPLASAPGTSSANGAAKPEATTVKGLSALVVDDNVDGADMLAKLLKRQGYAARAVYHGDEVLPALRESVPDVAFLDIGLPGKDGYQLAEEIRADESLGGVHLVALTGYGQEEDRERALAVGFDVHLLKPLSIDALKGVLAKVSARNS